MADQVGVQGSSSSLSAEVPCDIVTAGESAWYGRHYNDIWGLSVKSISIVLLLWQAQEGPVVLITHVVVLLQNFFPYMIYFLGSAVR